MSPPYELELGERARILLRTLIRRYIEDGRPVGSRVLAREAGLEVSPATVRNVMADLEAFGYVVSPHTSAGRVPTDRGLRLYVDCLLEVEPLRPDTIELLRQRLVRDCEEGREELADSASDLLSQLTRLAGVVTLPRRERAVLRHVDFLPLSGQRVLAILVVNQRDVQNRVIETDRSFSTSELQRIANYLNTEFIGVELSQVRRSLLAAMQVEREHLDALLGSVAEVASKALAEEADPEGYVVAGQTHLMELEDLSDVERLRQLFEAFTQKRDILHLLDRCARAEGVQVYIGRESGHAVFDGMALVTARYAVAGEPVGVLGVIGPSRMAYDRIVPIVDATARMVGSALNPPR
ncbi:MAG: heat-inducible transcriptional repressor HrcA [Halorhodospira sp.]